MITHATTVRRSRVAIWVFLFAGTVMLALDALGAETDDAGRVSISTQDKPGITTADSFAELAVQGNRDKAGHGSHAKAELRQSGEANIDFWFYAADVELFNDRDSDGFYHGIDLWFDADTWYDFAEVYAVVYLSLDGGPWNEYVATDDFVLTGTASDDDYVIVTELVSGYPSGSYDILIELYDAYDNAFLAWIGPEETSELAFLPLEDSDRDVAEIPEVIVVRERGGGSTGGASILFLALAALARRRRARCA